MRFVNTANQAQFYVVAIGAYVHKEWMRVGRVKPLIQASSLQLSVHLKVLICYLLLCNEVEEDLRNCWPNYYNHFGITRHFQANQFAEMGFGVTMVPFACERD